MCPPSFSQHSEHGTELGFENRGVFQQRASGLGRALELYSVTFLNDENPMHNVDQLKEDEEVTVDAISLLQHVVSQTFFSDTLATLRVGKTMMMICKDLLNHI